MGWSGNEPLTSPGWLSHSDEEKVSCSTCGEFRATLKKCSKCKQVSMSRRTVNQISRSTVISSKSDVQEHCNRQ